MENHHDINLSQLREHIIRYGAKLMERYESDLFYDCRAVEKMQPGEVQFWMVSGSHSYLYSAREIAERDINVHTVWGSRCDFRITCTGIEPYDAPKESNMRFDMERVWDVSTLQKAVDECRR